MKKIMNFALALLLVMGSIFSGIGTQKVSAQEVWTEEDFLYSSPGHIIAFSDKGMEKQKTNKNLKFPEGTISVKGNYMLYHQDDPVAEQREFGRPHKTYESVTFPDSVTDIGYATLYMAKIDKLILPKGLKRIGGIAFFPCGLKEVNLPEGLLEIGHNAFEKNELTEITIPSTVNKIDKYAFVSNQLNKIVIKGQPEIKEYAFSKQKSNYSPKQNPFYENHFGYKNNIGFKELPDGLTFKDGEYSFLNDSIEEVTAKFEIPAIHYDGEITIHNPHKWSNGTQSEATQDDVTELENKIKELEDKILELSNDKIKNEKKIKELEEKLINCQDKGEKLKIEKKELEKAVEEKNVKISELEKAIVELTNQDAKNKAELEQLKDEVIKLQEENSELKNELESTKWELEAEKAKEDKQQERIKELEEKVSALEKEIEDKDKIIQEKNEKIKELETQLAKKVEEIEKLNETIQSLEKEKENCCKKIEVLIKEIEALKTDVEKTKNDLTEKITSLEEQITNQEETIKKLKEELDKKAKEFKELLEQKKDKEDSEKEKAELDKKLEELIAKQNELEKKQKEEEEKKNYKIEVDDITEGDKEVFGKTQKDWYVDIFHGKRRIGNATADSRGYFTVKLKEDVKAEDKLTIHAEHPKKSKKNIEITVTIKKKETKDNSKDTKQSKDNILNEVNGFKEFSVFQIGKNYYNLINNGKKTSVYMDVKPYIENDRTMLPLRYVAYTLGMNVEYEDATREAIFSNKENLVLPMKSLRLNIDTGIMKTSDGKIHYSDTNPVIINGRVHASITNIANAFGLTNGTIEDGRNNTIEWDQKNKAVYVFKNVK
ncbi:MAG: leucine-rich repeat protein [Tissierellia bacterium]|nr:leucine-rich repeat protein [Tissierellia bacterium]